MEYIGFNILKEIVKKRELTLVEVSKLLPKKFNDHRDFYVLASLYTGGYIDCTMVREKANWDTSKNNLVAELFYTMTFGKGTFKYKDMTVTNEGDFNKEKIFCTAKGEMYFAEQGKKIINGQTTSEVNINFTQVVNFMGKFSKQHPVIVALSIISMPLVIWWTSIQIINYYANVVYPDQIYLSLWETGKKVPINNFTQEIPPIMPIKPNESITLRFVLTQNNVNSPQITSIFLTFPDDAKVEPIPYDGWSWVRNNDVAKRYFLNFTTSQIIASRADCNLPSFNVEFKRVGLLNFSYQIIGNKIEPIYREFIINTDWKYEEWLAKRKNETSPNTFKSAIRLNDYDANTASPSVVSGSVVTFDPPISSSYSNNKSNKDNQNAEKIEEEALY